VKITTATITTSCFARFTPAQHTACQTRWVTLSKLIWYCVCVLMFSLWVSQGYFYLTGYGGCTDIYTATPPANPHHEKAEELTEEYLNERRQVVLEKEQKKKERIRGMQVKASSPSSSSSYSWVYWIAGGGLTLFVVAKKRHIITRQFKTMFP